MSEDRCRSSADKILWVGVILVVALIRGDKVLTTLEFCLVLLVAAIPVAMPTVLSVTIAVGARLLAKKEAIVTRLSAIEGLAGVDVLCSDKTGTRTQNKLTLGDPFTVDGVAPDKVILRAALASRAEDKDTIDLAVIGGVKDDKEVESCYVLHFMPFDPVHKRTEATVKGAHGKQFFVAKGARTFKPFRIGRRRIGKSRNMKLTRNQKRAGYRKRFGITASVSCALAGMRRCL